MGNIEDYYEKYDEDNRLKNTNSRRVEFILTTNLLNKYIKPNYKILELGAGTGIYSFYYAKRCSEVICTDLTTKHIKIINNKLSKKNNIKNLKTKQLDATNLKEYEADSFDFITCLGPLYHLTDEKDRIKCINESLRVLKKGGYFAIAYVNKHFVLHSVMLRNKQYLKQEFIDKVLKSGTLQNEDPDCFWTDSFFTTPSEIESFINNFNVKIVDHIGTDGINPFIRDYVDEMTEEEYDNWIYYMINFSKERNVLGISNHGLIVVKKI